MFPGEPGRASGGPGKPMGQAGSQSPPGRGARRRPAAPPAPSLSHPTPQTQTAPAPQQNQRPHSVPPGMCAQHSGPQITSMPWRPGASGRPWSRIWMQWPPGLLGTPSSIRQFSCTLEGPCQTSAWRPSSLLAGSPG